MFERSEKQVPAEELDLAAMWHVENLHCSNPEILLFENGIEAPFSLLEKVLEG